MFVFWYNSTYLYLPLIGVHCLIDLSISRVPTEVMGFFDHGLYLLSLMSFLVAYQKSLSLFPFATLDGIV